MSAWMSIRNFLFLKKNTNLELKSLAYPVFDNSSPVIFFKIQIKPEFRFDFLSEGISDLLGFTSSELMEHPSIFTRQVCQEDVKKWNHFLEYPSGTKAIARICFNHRNGEIVWVELHANFSSNSINGIILDISDQIESEKKLKESEERLVLALQTTGIVIWEWDVESSIVTWKSEIEEVLGVQKGLLDESIESYFNLIYSEDRENFLESLSQAMQSADTYSAEHRIIDKNGEIRWVEAYAQIFRDSEGKTIRWLGTLRNITEARIREFENRELYERTRDQSSAIVALALDESFFTGDLDSSFKLILRTGSKVLGVERISIWMFREDHSALDCLYYYLASKDKIFVGEHYLISENIPKYYKSIVEGRVFVSNDALKDTRTSEFLSTYSKNINLGGMMDASIRVRGQTVGVLSIENIGKSRNWRSDEVMFAGLLADQAAISIINSERNQNEDQIRLLNKNLEKIVEERTLQLRNTNKDLYNTLANLSQAQNQLILSEKMASLGQLIAGIAHEINNPVGAIKASIEMIRNDKSRSIFRKSSIPYFIDKMGEEEVELAEKFYDYALKITDIPTGLKRRHSKSLLEVELQKAGFPQYMVLAEKLIDIGVLHLPEEYDVLMNKEFSESLLLFIASKIFEEKNYASIESSIKRVTNLVRSLKNFTHMSKIGEKVVFSVEESIETVLTLFNNKIKAGIELTKHFKPVPTITCYPDDLIQLWTNLVQNALQAMNYRGSLELRIEQDFKDKVIIVEIIDSGPGIPEEIQHKIFQPFFTTKALGEGSGIGLDISKKIVENHKGKISFESNPGRTVFRVLLPIQ